MGFFSGGNSKSYTTNNIRNTSLQGVEGQNVISGDGNTVTTVMSDQGAIATAEELAKKALDSHNSNTGQLFDLAGSLFEQQGESGRETLRVADSMAEKAIKNSLSFAGQTQAKTSELLRQAVNNSTKTSTASIAAQNALAKQAIDNAQTGGQVVVAESMTKIMYALAAVGGLVIVVVLVKGAK